MWYPFLRILVSSLVTPGWDQSRPTMGMRCPITSDLVMVPSMSDTTILACMGHRKMWAWTVCSPWRELLTVNVMIFPPGLRFMFSNVPLGGFKVFRNRRTGFWGELVVGSASSTVR